MEPEYKFFDPAVVDDSDKAVEFSDMSANESPPDAPEADYEYLSPASNDSHFAQFKPDTGKRHLGKKDFSRKRTLSQEMLLLSFDTEYYKDPVDEGNCILSYQYVFGSGDLENSIKGIIYPENMKKSGRISFDDFLVEVIEDGLLKGIIDSWPTDIILCAHFLRADLFTFKDAFTNIKTKIKGIRKTVASLDDPYGVDLEAVMKTRIDKEALKLWSTSGNDYHLNVTFYDTMLLAPAGYQSLKAVGELVGVPKLEIPKPFSIERMNEYFETDRAGAEEYAINDAIISYLHMKLMIDFCKELGVNRVPFTLGGLAVKACTKSLENGGVDKVKGAKKTEYLELFGFTSTKIERWVEREGKPSGFITSSHNVLTPSRMVYEQLATETYSGGRGENYHTGPTPDSFFNDFDIPSCYTAILNVLRPLDYDAAYMSKSVSDYAGDVFGLLRVRFKFPESIKFPSLPVRTDNDALCFPSSGLSYCTASEIEVADNLGAEIEIITGIIIPWLNDERIFEPFMTHVRERRRFYKDNGDVFEEKLWKEIGNSLYGKLAQGLRPKTAFDVQVGYSKQMPASKFTNPYFASIVTGMARAVLAEQLNSIPSDKMVVSVTTDGFLTDASLSDIDLNGPACSRFRDLFHLIDENKGEILELKHGAKQLIGMKTRGQLTIQAHDDFEPVIAKANVKLPQGVTDPHAYMLDLYLDRYPGEKHESKMLTSSRDMFLYDKDLVNTTTEQRLNLEPDYKRRLTNPRIVKLADGREHIALDSEPFKTIHEQMFTRKRFDVWRKNNCLKTIADWDDWQEMLSMYTASNAKGVRIQKGEKSGSLMCRLFLRGFAQKQWGLDSYSITSKDLAAWFELHDYPVTPAAVRGAKRSKLVEGSIPLTKQTLELLKLLIAKFPMFEYEALFAPSTHDELQVLMSE
jgi:hypothetical protein